MKTSKRFHRAAAVAVAAAAVGGVLPAAAAVDYFLKIDGIPGESTDDKHKGEIEILSWSFGVSRSAATGAARSASKPCVQDLSLAKNLDKATPLLLVNAATGMVIPTAILIGRKAGEKQQDYLKIELKDVLVSSVQAGGSSQGAPIDQFSLNFTKMTVEYKEQKPDGSLGDAIQTTFGGGSC